MTIGDAAGTVTICSRERSGLYADYHGLTVRNFPARERRFAWAEISRFDERATGGGDSAVQWELIIVLHTGQTVPVSCTTSDEGSPETLATLRQVAERHGIPADLTGVAMRDGKPPETGLYEDPGGYAGVRYWDGAQWSPLMPPGRYGFLDDAKKSAARWAALPVSPQPWRYAAVRAARWRAIVVGGAALTPVLMAAWVMTGAWHARWYGSLCGVLALSLGWLALIGGMGWRSYWRVDKAANDTQGSGTPGS